MKINRDNYIAELEKLMWNGMAKILTGPKGVGKTFLLFHLFKEFLLCNGVKENEIIEIRLDSKTNKSNLEALTLYEKILDRIKDDNRKYYVFIDEIQQVHNFIPLMNSFVRMPNVDFYVTGSNSYMLSTDVPTEFEGRAWNVPVRPLSFSEVKQSHTEWSIDDTWNYYKTFGGFPLVLTLRNNQSRKEYLKSLVKDICLKEVVFQKGLKSSETLNSLLENLATSSKSFINKGKIVNSISQNNVGKISYRTFGKYLSYLENSFLIEKAERTNVAHRRIRERGGNYYFEDPGIFNALNDFKNQNNEDFLMESTIYNELISRHFNVKVGIVPFSRKANDKKKNRSLNEIGFVADKFDMRAYVLFLPTFDCYEQKRLENKLIEETKDNFPKIIITKEKNDNSFDDLGFINIGFFHFLLNSPLSYMDEFKFQMI